MKNQMGLPIGDTVPLPTQILTPNRITLTGKTVALRPVDAATDAAPLFVASHHTPEALRLWRYMTVGPFKDEGDMRRWLAGRQAEQSDVYFTVIQVSTQRAVGMAAFINIVPEMLRLEIGSIWYEPGTQRTGVNTETAYLMLCEAFERLKYRRVEWKCDALNAGSRDAALRLGFSFEGIFRQHMIIKGHNRDTAWYALLDRDWGRVKQNMERYLYSGDVGLSLRQLNQ